MFFRRVYTVCECTPNTHFTVTCTAEQRQEASLPLSSAATSFNCVSVITCMPLCAFVCDKASRYETWMCKNVCFLEVMTENGKVHYQFRLKFERKKKRKKR